MEIEKILPYVGRHKNALNNLVHKLDTRNSSLNHLRRRPGAYRTRFKRRRKSKRCYHLKKSSQRKNHRYFLRKLLLEPTKVLFRHLSTQVISFSSQSIIIYNKVLQQLNVQVKNYEPCILKNICLSLESYAFCSYIYIDVYSMKLYLVGENLETVRDFLVCIVGSSGKISLGKVNLCHTFTVNKEMMENVHHSTNLFESTSNESEIDIFSRDIFKLGKVKVYHGTRITTKDRVNNQSALFLRLPFKDQCEIYTTSKQRVYPKDFPESPLFAKYWEAYATKSVRKLVRKPLSKIGYKVTSTKNLLELFYPRLQMQIQNKVKVNVITSIKNFNNCRNDNLPQLLAVSVSSKGSIKQNDVERLVGCGLYFDKAHVGFVTSITSNNIFPTLVQNKIHGIGFLDIRKVLLTSTLNHLEDNMEVLLNSRLLELSQHTSDNIICTIKFLDSN